MNACSLCGQPTTGRTHGVCAAVNTFAKGTPNAKVKAWLCQRLGCSVTVAASPATPVVSGTFATHAPAWPVLSDYNFSDPIPAGVPPYFDSPNYAGNGWGTVTGGKLTRVPGGAQLFYTKGDAGLCGSSPGKLYRDFAPTKQLYVAYGVTFSDPFSFPGTPGAGLGDPEVHSLFLNAAGGGALVLDLQADNDIRFVNEFAGNPAGASNVRTAVSPQWALGIRHRVEVLADYAGTIRVWMDDRLVMDASGIYFPADAGFNHIELNGTWGGCETGAPASDGWILYDRVVLSAP